MMASGSLPAVANASPLFVNSSIAACGSLEHASPNRATRTLKPQSERAITGMAPREIIYPTRTARRRPLCPGRRGCLTVDLKVLAGRDFRRADGGRAVNRPD